MPLSFKDNVNSFERRHKTLTNLSVIGISFLVILATLVIFYAHIRTEYLNAPIYEASLWTPSLANTSAASLCAKTDHKKICLDTLHSIPSAPAGVYLKMTINASIGVLIQAYNQVSEYKNQTSGIDSMSMDDCGEMLDCALYTVMDAYYKLGLYKELRTQVKTLLSAAISFQVTCLDGIKNSKIRASMFLGLNDAIQQIGNALAMVDSDVSNSNGHNFTIKSGDEEDANLKRSSATKRMLLQEDFGLEAPAVVGTEEGDYTTINEALQGMVMGGHGYSQKHGQYIIHVKAGTYHESVTIQRNMPNVLMYGDGPKLTVITGNKTTEGFTMYQTATFAVLGEGFVCKSMTIENTGDATARGIEGVALRVQSDTAVFSECRIHGYRVSLHALAFRQFFTGCIISGNRDFLFGDSAMIVQNSTIMVRRSKAKPKMITIISQGRVERHESTGFVLQNCTFKLDQHSERENNNNNNSVPIIYLGRPRKPYSRTVVMESDLRDLIQPQGWTVGSDTSLQQTVTCIEYDNKGLSADTSKRVAWKGFTAVSNAADVQSYTIPNFIQGYQWIEPVTYINRV